jgi:hypothetical protein
MNQANRKAVHALLAGAVVLLVWASPGRTEEENISFKKRADEEKRFVSAVGDAIVKAAHHTSRKRALVKYEFSNPKANRTELTIKMEYYGLVSNKKYVADIVIKLDSTEKNSWEVLNIDYSDNNNISANLRKIQETIKKLNE